MPLADKPPYVTRWNEQAFAPPYLQQGCSLYGFFLRCDRSALQVFCNRFLIDPSQGCVQATALDHVLLYFCRFARSSSLHTTDRQRGWYGENECGLWIPLQQHRQNHPVRFAFLPLSLFVDSGPAAIAGREVLGFPKELGHITLPTDHEPPSLFALDALMQIRHGAESPARWGRLIEVRQSAASAWPKGPLALPRPLLRLLLPALRQRRSSPPLLLLKQIRDAADPARACHQSIVSCVNEVQTVRSLHCLPGSYDVVLNACASHPLAELGIAPQALRAVRGFSIDMDFTLMLDDVLWEAT